MISLPQEVTCMVLPFNREDVSEDIAFEEIKEALIHKITADSILMLDNIDTVNIEADGYNEKITYKKIKNRIEKLDNCLVYALGMSTIVSKKNGSEATTDNDYLLFSDNKTESSAIVFQVGGKDGKRLIPIKNSKVYAYFPTAREAHQNFYIHAPFDTTPARDNFKEGAEYGKHNLKLIDNICDLITDSLMWMRDNGYLSISGFNTVFPIYEYDRNDILRGIYENSVDIINSGFELLPTNQPGLYKAIDDICVPQASVIVDVFSDNDLHQLIGRNKYWLAKEISTEAFAELRRFLSNNFKLQTLDWPALVQKLTGTFLEKKNVEWMERLMARIESYCIRRTSFDSHYLNVTKIPFVRTSSGKQICARDEDGRLQVYLNNHNIARFRIAENFISNETIRSFYRNALLIPEYNVEQETVEKILPNYLSRNVERSIQQNIEDLKTIKDAIYVNPSLVDIHLADKYIVTDGEKWYRPSELYIRSGDVRNGFSLLRGIKDFKYLSEAYFDDTVLNIKLDIDFFKRIGCNSTIREMHASKSDYLKSVEKYLGRKQKDEYYSKFFSKTYISQKINWDFYYEGFPEVFRSMSFKKSIDIARFLNSNIMKFDIQGEIVAADDQHFSGRNVDSVVAYTMLGLYLSFEKWIYINGNEEPQRPIDIDKNDLRPEYQAVKRVIGILPFKEVKNALMDYLEANIKGNDLELVKRYISNPEKLVKVAEAMAKNEAREEAKKGKSKSIVDLIQNADKAQQPTSNKSDVFEVAPISEQGKMKREANLDRILAESLDQEIYLARGLQFASRVSNAEEKQFLLSEYDGRCQICGKQIIKHDGSEYFEAINVIKFSDLSAKLAKSSRLGWNSLCLCPNCAAEYNYCSKRISSIYDQIISTEVEPGSDDPIEIYIELPEGVSRTIHYSPRHFIALKEAIKIFTKGQ